MYEFPSHHSFKHFSLNGSLRTSGYTVEDDFLVAFDDCYKLFSETARLNQPDTTAYSEIIFPESLSLYTQSE